MIKILLNIKHFETKRFITHIDKLLHLSVSLIQKNVIVSY